MDRREVEIPYEPRPMQLSMHRQAWERRFGVAVCHRRFGKTVWAVNHLQRSALTCRKQRPRFAYIGPTYKQAKTNAWDFLRFYSGCIPSVRYNETELRVDYPNEARIRLFGAEDPDALRGMYLDGAILDEYGLMEERVFTEIILPAVADRGGWVIFLGTPNGKNGFWKARDLAASSSDWWIAEHKASQTGLISASELDMARTLMTADEFAQEFECSFEASVRGAIYAKEMTEARDAGRIGRVAYDPALSVDTVWDLGVGDATAIIFAQRVGRERRIIDYYEASGEGLQHYAKVLQQKRYVYGKHWGPHDIKVRELSSGKSRLEIAEKLGIRFEIVPDVDLEDGINAARLAFPLTWIDSETCRPLIEALQNYRRDYNTRLGEFKATPVHDWSSHGADAFRYFCLTDGPRLKTTAGERSVFGDVFRPGHINQEGAWMR